MFESMTPLSVTLKSRPMSRTSSGTDLSSMSACDVPTRSALNRTTSGIKFSSDFMSRYIQYTHTSLGSRRSRSNEEEALITRRRYGETLGHG